MNRYKLISNTLSLAMVLFTLLIIFPVRINFFTVLSTYSVQFVFLFLMLGMLFLVLDSKRLMFTALGCSAFLSAFLKNNSNANIIMPLATEEGSIRIEHINLSNSENDVDAVHALIQKTKPDLLTLQEYTPFWKQALGPALDTLFNVNSEQVRIDPFGIGMWSNIPGCEIDTFYCSTIPGLMATVSMDDKLVNVISTYISPSLDRASTNLADEQLRTINEIISQQKNSAIIVGEFNHVYWSNKIRTFRAKGQLLNSRRNIAPTSFSIPVDQIFHTSDLECIGFDDMFDRNNRRLGISGRYQFGTLQENSSIKSTYGYLRK